MTKFMDYLPKTFLHTIGFFKKCVINNTACYPKSYAKCQLHESEDLSIKSKDLI